MKQDVIIIAGMHRSGTSLTSSLLMRSGLFIGDDLLSNGFDNIKGHFEDLELLKLHEQDLKLKGLDTRGLKWNVSANLAFEESSKPKIADIIESRKDKKLWGWKEPRTTLYLQAWKREVPDLKCIAVYRHYDDVVNSMMRRYTYKLKKGVGMSAMARIKHLLVFPLYSFFKKREAYKAWCTYNENILAFANANPKDVVVIELDHFMSNYNAILKEINSKFQLDLKSINVEEIFDQSLLHKRDSDSNTFRMFSISKLNALTKRLKEVSIWI